MGASKLSSNRKTDRPQIDGYDITKWNNTDANEDGIAIDNHADHIDPLDVSIIVLSNYNPIQDTSINILDVSVSVLSNYNPIQDTSILTNTNSVGTLHVYDAIQDISISTLGGGASLTYVDGSLATRDVSISININEIAQLDASILNNLIEINQLDSSIVILYNYNTIQDGSIVANDVSILSNLNEIYQFDASIVRLDAYDAIQDSSMIANDIFHSFHDGTFEEALFFDVSSNNTIIWGTITPQASTLTMIFSDGLTVLADASLNLTAGTEINPQENFIYITQTNKILEVSTSDWPSSEEHIKVASVVIQDVSTVFKDSALKNHNWNDPLKMLNDQGHLSNITERMRQNNAKWQSGTAGSVFINDTPTPDNVFFSSTSGIVYQMHRHSFPAFDMSTGSHIHIVNHDVSAYFEIDNINTQINDALGNSLNNSSFSFVVWGSISSRGEDQLMLNLPTGNYAFNAPQMAVNDANNYSVYDIPKIFQGVGFLIARLTFTYKTDDWVLFENEDLRGKIPNNTAGGGAGGVGVIDFTGLTDTPNSYSGNSLNLIRVNVGETALEFISNSMDASIVRLDAYNAIQDTSILGGGGVSQAYVDSSLGERDTSLNILFAYDTIQDASILAGGTGGIHLTYADTSTMVTAQGSQITDSLYYDSSTTSTFRYLGTTTTVLKTDYDIIGGRPLQIVYPSDASMFNDQANQWKGYFYYDSSIVLYLEYLGTTSGDITDYRGKGVIEETISFNLSDYTTDISAGTGNAFWTAPWDCSIQSAIGTLLVTDPSGANAVFDLNLSGTTTMSTNKIIIEDGSTNSINSATQPTFTIQQVEKGNILSADIDQAGSAVGGVGAHINLIVTRE